MVTSKKETTAKKTDKKIKVVEVDTGTDIVEVEERCIDAKELLSQAVAKGANIETIERLMILRKDILAEEAKLAFNEAMANFQEECPVIEKTKAVSTNQNKVAYKYAPIESIVKQLKTILKKHGFRYSTTMKLSETGVKVLCRVVHKLGHEEISEMEVPLGTKTAVMSQSQVVAAASTFAKRYAFLNAFGIMTGDEDNDTASERGDVAEPAKVAPKAAPKQDTVKADDLDNIKIMEILNGEKTILKVQEIYGLAQSPRKKVWTEDEQEAINKCYVNAVVRIKKFVYQGPPAKIGTGIAEIDGSSVVIVGVIEAVEGGWLCIKPKDSPSKDKGADDDSKPTDGEQPQDNGEATGEATKEPSKDVIDVEMITPDQIKKIHVLKKEQDITDDQYKKMIQALFGDEITTCKNLSKEKAGELIAHMDAMTANI